MNPCDTLIEVTYEVFGVLRKLDQKDMWLECVEHKGIAINITGWDMGKGLTRKQKSLATDLLFKLL